MSGQSHPSGRRNLVFARVGRDSFHRHWLAEAPAARNWDLQLSTWLPDLAPTLGDGDFPASLDAGVKFSSVCAYFAARPELLAHYDYIMLPDDDLLFDAGAISRLFDTCHDYELTIAQPALREASYFSYPIVVQCPRFKLRYSNFVEPMAPIIKARYLVTLLPYFRRWPTGWGHDDFWSLLMPDPCNAAAIIDSDPVLHLRPLQTGEIYQSFRARGMDPLRDVAEIRASFDNVPQGRQVYSGILRSGQRIGRKRTSVLNGLHLLRVASATRDRKQTVRTGLGMLLRVAASAGYKPRLAVYRPGAVPDAEQSIACAS